MFIPCVKNIRSAGGPVYWEMKVLAWKSKYSICRLSMHSTCTLKCRAHECNWFSDGVKVFVPYRLFNFYNLQHVLHIKRQHVYLTYIKGSRPEWCISSLIYSKDTPFWLETLDMQLNRHILCCNIIRSNCLLAQAKSKK